MAKATRPALVELVCAGVPVVIIVVVLLAMATVALCVAPLSPPRDVHRST